MPPLIISVKFGKMKTPKLGCQKSCFELNALSAFPNFWNLKAKQKQSSPRSCPASSWIFEIFEQIIRIPRILNFSSRKMQDKSLVFEKY